MISATNEQYTSRWRHEQYTSRWRHSQYTSRRRHEQYASRWRHSQYATQQAPRLQKAEVAKARFGAIFVE